MSELIEAMNESAGFYLSRSDGDPKADISKLNVGIYDILQPLKFADEFYEINTQARGSEHEYIIST